jgi:hypothetical protein
VSTEDDDAGRVEVGDEDAAVDGMAAGVDVVPAVDGVDGAVAGRGFEMGGSYKGGPTSAS